MNDYDSDCCHAGDGCCGADLMERAVAIHRAHADRTEAERHRALRADEVEDGIRISALIHKMIGQELRGARICPVGNRTGVEYARMRFGLTTDRADLVFAEFFCVACDRWIVVNRIIDDPRLGLERIGAELALHTKIAHRLVGAPA